MHVAEVVPTPCDLSMIRSEATLEDAAGWLKRVARLIKAQGPGKVAICPVRTTAA